jgi:hypothetical protein
MDYFQWLQEKRSDQFRSLISSACTDPDVPLQRREVRLALHVAAIALQAGLRELLCARRAECGVTVLLQLLLHDGSESRSWSAPVLGCFSERGCQSP